MTTTTNLDPRPAFREAATVAASVIDAVRDDQLANPTPTDMTVGELLEHLVMVIRRVVALGRDQDPSTWPMDAADVRAGGWRAAWRDGTAEADAVWAAATLERQVTLPWTVTTAGEALATYTNEVVVHVWDLAQGTGQSPEWSDETIAIADAAMRSQLPMADRTPMWEAAAQAMPPGVAWESPFANAVDVPADASPLDRLLAWNGRQP